VQPATVRDVHPRTVSPAVDQGVRLFVSEFICGGALASEPLPDSLRREGRAMLWAIVEDLLRIPECSVVTTLDARLANDAKAHRSSRCDITLVGDASEERHQFGKLGSSCAAALVIAPETDGELAERVRRLESLGIRTLNCSPQAIDLCGDKLALARHLEQHSLATIPTELVDWSLIPPPHPAPSGEWVVKPRDGAGSRLTFRIRADARDDWTRVTHAYNQAGISNRAMRQPFVAGQSLSVGCLCDFERNVELFPLARQRLSPEFVFLGGTIPADLPAMVETEIRQLVRAACITIPGLRGYIGFDLLLPDAAPSQPKDWTPLVVEINPRLTTSYVGYRQLSANNLAERWLQSCGVFSNRATVPPAWSPTQIEFSADGCHNRPQSLNRS